MRNLPQHVTVLQAFLIFVYLDEWSSGVLTNCFVKCLSTWNCLVFSDSVGLCILGKNITMMMLGPHHCIISSCCCQYASWGTQLINTYKVWSDGLKLLKCARNCILYHLKGYDWGNADITTKNLMTNSIVTLTTYNIVHCSVTEHKTDRLTKCFEYVFFKKLSWKCESG